ncbi:hypothetical protein ACOSQ4_027092 [Xanthoceras sorbifolium]
MEHKGELDKLVEQVGVLMKKVETMAGDTVVRTEAELIKEYKEGKIDQWNPNEAMVAWAELQALAAGDEAKVEGEGAMVQPIIEDARIE